LAFVILPEMVCDCAVVQMAIDISVIKSKIRMSSNFGLTNEEDTITTR
jgi:hypothetical protein